MNLKEIGYFGKTHGIKGHLIFKTEFQINLEKLKALFVDSGGSKAPYFISEITEVKNGVIVLLEEIASIEKAKLLLGKKVFVEEKFVLEEEEEENWLGFELIDKNFGSLGEILAVNDNGQQLIVSLNFKNKDLILPLINEMIEKIDLKAKKIFYHAPDGLIELYLE